MYRFNAQKGNPQVLRYQVKKEDGTFYVAADISAMKLYVWETETLTEKTANGGETLIVNTCVLTAQEWEQDEEGYNFRIPTSGAYLTNDNKTYRVEVKVTPTSGSAFYLPHVELFTEETYSV
jgi:hypothetical protein